MRTSRVHLFRDYYSKGISHLCHLCFSRDLKAGKGMGKLYGRKKGRLQMCSNWRLLAWRSCTEANWKWGIICEWLGAHICLFLVGPKLGAGTKIREAVS